MKRVWLTSNPADLSNNDPDLVRKAAVALARYATAAPTPGHREVGDLVHEEVTEGRYKQWLDARAAGQPWAMHMIYSSCGDLIHWILRCLGCRDESLVNRNDDGGDHPWASGVNLQKLQGHPYTKKPCDETPVPKNGDAVFVDTASGGHVCDVDEWPMETAGGGIAADHAVTNDYGQPCAKHKVKTIAEGPLRLDGHQVKWWLDITAVPLGESAIVPDDFEGGIADENPYAEPGVTP
jgi:hypothetical protein